MKRLLVLLSLLLAACSSGTDSGVDAAADVADLAIPETVGDVTTDEEGRPEDGIADVPVADDSLLAGTASGEAFAPLGIPTAGYGQGIEPGIPHSPFTEAFAATVRQQTPILARSLYLKRGEQELIVLRMDKIGTPADFLGEFTRRLDAATGRSWDGRVVLASTHTHLGPGRVWENMLGEFANDLFWPFYYERFMSDVVGVALASIDDAAPARMGHGRTECPECHNDRRCENPKLLDSTLWVVRVDGEDGEPKALLVNFAIHGTVFGWQDVVLSGDAPGMIEQKLLERFDHSVEVLLLQSWGGDISPGNPEVAPAEPVNETIPGDYDRLERIGHAAAEHVMAVLDTIETSADATFDSITVRPPIGYDLVGYEAGEWPYVNGGMMCGTNGESHCWGEEGDPPKMGCIPMPPGLAPTQFVLTAFRLGELLLVTLPGEPHTDYSLEIAAAAGAAAGMEDVAIVGYAQDHWGYLMKEYDWLLGGYEPTVSFWGPRQGDYMAAQVPHVVHKLVDPEYVLPFEDQPGPNALPEGGTPDKYTPMDSLNPPAGVSDPDDTIAVTGEAVYTWQGGDPWLGTPYVVLEREEDGGWQPVARQNTLPFDNRSYLMETSIVWLPSWNEDKVSTTREFHWTIRMPARRNVPTPDELAPGSYRFRAVGSAKQGGAVSEYELTSAPFTLE
jgi:neutral ceramidase